MTLPRQTIVGAGVAAALLAAIALVAANFVGGGENGGGPEYAVTLGVSVLVALWLFGRAIPRSDRPAQTGLVVGAIAVLSIAAYWTGLPYVLGPAAVVLGLLGRARTGSRAPAVVAIGLGALATAGAVAAVIVDGAT